MLLYDAICYMLIERTSNSFLVTFRSTVAVESLLNLGLPFELTVWSTSHLYMTRADAIPQGTYELSPSDSIPSSEQAGTDVGWCEWVGGCLEAREGYWEAKLRGPEGEGDRDMGGKWRTCGWEEKQRGQKEKERGFLKKDTENSKRDTIIADIYCSRPPSQGCAKLWLMGCEGTWKS